MLSSKHFQTTAIKILGAWFALREYGRLTRELRLTSAQSKLIYGITAVTFARNMGTSSHGSSASRSRSPRDIHGPNQTIPELFRAQGPVMVAPLPASTSPQHHIEITLSPTEQSPSTGSIHPTSTPQLNIQDLRAVANDIKDTLSAAIADLHLELQGIAGRVQEVENAMAVQYTAIKRVVYRVNSHTLQLHDLHRHVEELGKKTQPEDYRSSRTRFESDQIVPTVTDIFNRLLDRPPDTQIAMERIHRALRPRGRETDPQRDIICYINDFAIKESVLKKARERD